MYPWADNEMLRATLNTIAKTDPARADAMRANLRAQEEAWDALLRGEKPVSVKDASAYMYRWCNSMDRGDTLRWLSWGYMNTPDLIELAGDIWQMMDDCWRHSWLIRILRGATLEDRKRFMTDSERAAWADLPAVVTVYRGCYPRNRRGVSFSLSRTAAERFPYLNRYRFNQTPLLIEARVRRDDVLLKLEREEQEVVALYRRSTKTTVLADRSIG